jgi:hypothetical protein
MSGPVLATTIVLFTMAHAAVVSAQSAPTGSSTPAVPADPVSAIVEAFKTHHLVAIGDNHGNEQIHQFRLDLVRDPRLAGVVQDIVVEFGSAQSQSLIDRFVGGESIAYADLQRVWQDTTQIEETWDLPIYGEFFRVVRDVNRSRPANTRLRVLLGDPAVDWTAISSASDLRALPDRDAHAADLIRREVLGKGRRALVIYGDQHLVRRTTVADAPDTWARGVVALLERQGDASVFSIHTDTRSDLSALQSDVVGWPRPSLIRLAGTPFGAVIEPAGPGQRKVMQQEQFDALLYLGPPSAMTQARLSDAQCRDRSYLQMRLGRLALLPAPSTAPSDPAERLTVSCAFRGDGTEIADTAPAFTALVRATIDDAVLGRVDPSRFSMPLRPRLVAFFQTYGQRILKPLGAVRSVTLLGDATVLTRRYRQYRVQHEAGAATWFVGVASDGTIASMQPRR